MLDFFQYLLSGVGQWWNNQSSSDILWHVFGFVAQAMFFSRWLVQWIMSERAQKSVVPVIFWFLSLFGGIMMLIYVTYLGSPALIIGQAVGLTVYIRNIMLIGRERKESREAALSVAAE